MLFPKTSLNRKFTVPPSFIKSHLKVQKVLLAIWGFLLHNMAYKKEPWETKKSLGEVCFWFFDQLQFDNLGRGVLQKNEIYERTWLEHDFIHSHCLVPHCKFWWSLVQFYCEFLSWSLHRWVSSTPFGIPFRLPVQF